MDAVDLTRANERDADARSRTTYRVSSRVDSRLFQAIEQNGSDWAKLTLLFALGIPFSPMTNSFLDGLLTFMGLAAILAFFFFVVPALARPRPTRHVMDIGPDDLFFSASGRRIRYRSIKGFDAFQARKYSGDRIIGQRGTSVYYEQGKWVPDPSGKVFKFYVIAFDGTREIVDDDLLNGLDASTVLELIARRAAAGRFPPDGWSTLVTYTYDW